VPRLSRAANAAAPPEIASTKPAKSRSTVFEGSDLSTAQPHQGVTREGPSATRVRLVRAKHAFLADFALWANITSACQVAGIHRNTYYSWLERDPAFALGLKQADAAATERLEREAYRRAVVGSPYKRTSYWKGEPVGTDEKIEYSDQLLMLLLRARRPETYREKVDLNVTTVVKTIAGLDPASVL